MNVYRIAQIGTFDCENMGDLLFPVVMEEIIKKENEHIKIDMFSPIGGNMPFFPDKHVYPIHQLRTMHQENPYDALIIGGGDLIRLDPTVASPEKYSVLDATLWLWVYPILIGLTEKIPVLFNAPGVPFSFTEKQFPIVRNLLQIVDYISVRDEKSRELLMETGFTGNIHVVPDTITLIEYAFPRDKLPTAALQSKIPFQQWGKYVILQLNALEEHVAIEEYIKLIRHCHEKMNCKVVLMPIGYVHEDQEILQTLFGRISDDMDYVIMIDSKLAPLEMVSLIANSNGFIGTSLHGSVIAYSYGVPSIAINPSSLTKVDGFYQFINIPQFVCSSVKDVIPRLLLLNQSTSMAYSRNEIVEHSLAHINNLFHYIKTLKGKSTRQLMNYLKNIPVEQEKTFTSGIYWAKKDNAFSQEQFVTLKYQEKKGHYYKFKRIVLPENTFSIRFDPCEGYDCTVVSNVEAVTNAGVFSLSPYDASYHEGYALFGSKDPQLFLLSEQPITWIELSAFILPFNKDNESAPLYAAIANGEHLRLSNNELKSQLANLEQLHQNLLANINKLENTIQSIQLENTSLNNTCKQQTAELMKLSLDRDACLTQIQSIQLENNTLSNTCAQQSNELMNLSLERNSLLQQIQSAQLENASLREEAQRNNFNFQMISNSQWWKLTAPGRKAIIALKSTRLGGLLFKGALSLKHEGTQKTLRKAINLLTKNRLAPGELPPADCNAFINQLQHHSGVVCDIKKLQMYLQNTKPYHYRILFVSHEMSLTGAPLVLMNFAKMVHETGNQAVIASPVDGPLRAEAERFGIPVVVVPDLFASNDTLDLSYPFNLVVACTIASAKVVSNLNGTDIPVVWWIHEAMVSYHPGFLDNMPQKLEKNIHVYSVCEYAKNMLLKFRPQYSSKILPYYMDDFASVESTSNFSLPPHGHKKVFTMVGSLEVRKGQDILVEAVHNLPKNVLEKCLFVIVGKKYHKPFSSLIENLCTEHPQNVVYYEQLSRDEIANLYKETDCLICASRDDPLPCVITEALAVGKPVICSEHTGYAPILEEMNSGLVYKNDDPQLLAKSIEKYLSTPSLQKKLQRNTRSTYEKHFTQQVFNEQATALLNRHILHLTNEESNSYNIGSLSLQQLIENTTPKSKTVSVVIPTYNAGEQFEDLLTSLEKQKGLDRLEIMIVDSGSKDKTVEICKKHRVHLIQIPNEQFSHSGARNMGAKAASNEILLFMTQDAMPVGKDWIEKLIDPIVNDNVAAVSPIEKCPPETDLYYKVASSIHVNYLGNSKTDLLNEGMADGDRASFRARSALNDVTTAINRKVFLRFLYRHDFAEDLDMGMRLIRSGYRVMLMSSVQTLHGHNRAAGYYFKRTLVDTVTTSQTILQMPVAGTCAQWDLAEMLGQGYGAMQWVYSTVLSQQYCDLSQFHDALMKAFGQARKLSVPEMKAHPANANICDNTLQAIAEILASFYMENSGPRYEVISALENYWLTALYPYAKKNVSWSTSQAEELLLCINKQLACIMGCELARLSPTDSLYPQIHQYTSGV